ncbi:aspartate kinase [Candidatus Marinamargulisbacteria bacterium SCGC AAA071-K20]|nr:aspartate kinase [Candidatus Marinamargulisbacteria bacterium SCGC AAA071-K20]
MTVTAEKKITVQKYGGTSVGSIERIKNVADKIILTYQTSKRVVAVVSAMGDTTDTLVGLAKGITSKPSPREYDALLSTGENVSASLLAMCLIEKGYEAISLTGYQAGITTEVLHSRAKILNIKTGRIMQELEKDRIVIITGFQGINNNGDVTTIGRGGSDTSAVAVAAALKAGECEIYTDVDGIYTTDPRKVADAKKLNEISYDEMLELASLGAKVLHPRAVECGKENQVVLHVRSSFNNEEGTRVKESSEMEINKPVTGVTLNEDEAIISLIGVPDKPGSVGYIFNTLAKEGVNVDMIIQNVEQNDSNNVSFSVHRDDLTLASSISQKIADSIGCSQVITDDSVAKISAVGVGMISKPGIAAQMFEALGKENINIKRITTSEIKISCAIDRKEAKKALAILHKEFELHV